MIVPGIIGSNPVSKDYVWWAVSFTVPCVLSLALFAPIMKVTAKPHKKPDLEEQGEKLLDNDD